MTAYFKEVGLALSSKFVGQKQALFDRGDLHTKDRHYVIDVEADNGAIAQFDYYPSRAHPCVDTDNELLSALGCFVSDALIFSPDIDDFMDNSGFDLSTTKLSQLLLCYEGCKKSYHDLYKIVEDNHGFEKLVNFLSEKEVL